MANSKSKKVKKDPNMCGKHNKKFIYGFSGIQYCITCLDEIFQAIYQYGRDFEDINKLDEADEEIR